MHHVSGMKLKIEITINLITYFFTARLTGASGRVHKFAITRHYFHHTFKVRLQYKVGGVSGVSIGGLVGNSFWWESR